jgi:nucleotide-binding universal stress UspA family protein
VTTQERPIIVVLGSTSQHCVQHATTPVVVIRHPQERRT